MTGARFSIGQALGAGLRLPFRHPLAVLVWGLAPMLVSAATSALLSPVLAAMPIHPGGDSLALQAQMATSMGALSGLANLMSLLQVALGVVIWTAAMRATLKIGRPEKWLFLRAGMDELRVAVVMGAIVIGLYIVTIFIALIGLAFGFALYAMGEMAVVAGVFAFALIALLALLVAWSRLSLLPPASVVLSTFAFVEGWRMGRGQTGRLVGLNLAIWVIYMLVYVVVGAVVAAILIGGFFASGCVWPEDPQTVGEIMAAVKPMTGWIVLAFVPLTVFYGWAIGFMAGALTSAARQLADGAPVRDLGSPSV